MVEARNENLPSLYLQQFKKIDLLILDELGYVTFDLAGAELLLICLEANKHIIFKDFIDNMRLIYAVFVLLLVLMTSAKCKQTAEEWYSKRIALREQEKF